MGSSISDALAPEDTLDELEKRAVAPENREAFAYARYAIQADTSATTGAALVAKGFRHVGVFAQTRGWRSPRWMDAFVDRDRTTCITIRRSRRLLPLSAHYVTTHFADGTCIETVGRRRPLYPSAGPLTVRAGTGDLVADVEGHLAEVQARVASGARIVRVDDLDTAVRLSKLFLTHVMSTDTAIAVSAMHQNRGGRLVFAVMMIVFLAIALLSHFFPR